METIILSLSLFAAPKAVLVVSGDRTEDQRQAVRLETELRTLIRDNPSRTFRQLHIARTLRGKAAPYTRFRKDGAKKFAAAQAKYEALEIDQALAMYQEALNLASQALASRVGTRLWLQIEAEFGLRLSENGNSDGDLKLQRVLALDSKLEIESVALDDATKEKLADFRHRDPGQGKVRFQSERPMQISIAGIPVCISPCEVTDLPPNGSIPWRAEADGFEAQGGLTEAGATVDVPTLAWPGYAELLEALEPFERLFADESEEALATMAALLAPPTLIWVEVKGKKVQLVALRLRGKKKALVARIYATLEGGEHEIRETLLDLIQTSLSEEARVEPPPTGPSLWARLGLGSALAKMGDGLKPYRKHALYGLAGVAGTALLVGGVLQLNQNAPERRFDAVMGF